ncbi:hypothetical protein [Algicella marina]|uniref:Uncharacterized protein n=1 Tax=Algicella marina TaxID=2683284 RepID=A0A6P1T2H4_9RHOB|nr:hypothetical protein [Algicella marina]QHQ35509.1 hypothetical protein GO499_10080 [Algicella marina]
MDTARTSLAAELALGLLHGRERDEAQREMASDPEMQFDFVCWQESLVTLLSATEAPAVKPAPAVWRSIQAELFGRSPSIWQQILDSARDPHNRGLLVIVALAKLALLAWIIYLFF